MQRIFDLLELFRTTYSWKTDVFGYKSGGDWKSFSASDYLKYSQWVSQGFLTMGIGKGQHVATVMNNRPEWNFVDMGLLQIGAIQVPVYPTISREHFRYIFQNAEISLAIIENNEIYEYIADILYELDVKAFVIEESGNAANFNELLESGRQNPAEQKIAELSASISVEDTATLIYTSGTTGLPKGVMLSHHNLVSQFLAVSPISGFGPDHRALSFLPLCHVYERMLNYMYQYLGLSIYYAESISEIGNNIREVRPHVFCAVPRVLEKTYDKIVAAGRNLSFIPKNIFFWALNLGKVYDPRKRMSLFYRIQLFFADLLIYRKWRKALGNELEIVVSGSASLQEHISRVFWAAGIQILEGYGLTETSPVIAVSTPEPDGVKIGTVGPVLPGVEVKIAGDGEILTRGPHVMKGYYKNPGDTARVIDRDGWLKTGDIGEFEEGHFLHITDRKKEMIKTSGGKYIAPQVVERIIKSSPFIEQIIVVGEKKNYAAALIVPNFHHLKSWSRVKNITYKGPETAVASERIQKRIRTEIVKYNAELGRFEKIKRFVLLSKPFTIDNQTLSPTLKPRREQINKIYFQTIEDIYAGKTGVNVADEMH